MQLFVLPDRLAVLVSR